MVLDHFADDEVQEVLGEFGVEIGFAREALQPLDLLAFAQRIGGGQVMLGLELTDGLRVLEPLGESKDQHGIKAVEHMIEPIPEGEDEFSRPVEVYVPEGEYDRAYDLFFGDNESEI